MEGSINTVSHPCPSPSISCQIRTSFSGIERPPSYKPVSLDDIPGAADYLTKRAEDIDFPTEIYVGSCHCQAIKFACLDKPLKEAKLDDCACSICTGVRSFNTSITIVLLFFLLTTPAERGPLDAMCEIWWSSERLLPPKYLERNSLYPPPFPGFQLRLPQTSQHPLHVQDMRL